MIKYHLKKFIRQGFSFKQKLRTFEKNLLLTEEELTEYQNKHLQRIIHHCYKNVPYYTDLFNQLKLKPEDIKTKEDLKKLPYTDKQIVRNNYDKFIAKNKLKLLTHKVSTSGTTGIPLNLLRDYTSINSENACLWRFYRNCGDYGEKRITLRGTIISKPDQKYPPFWEYNPANKELLMSSYHLSTKNIQSYIDKIKDFKPAILYAYPSTANLLASLYHNLNEHYTFKAIFTSSESVSDEQRSFIETTFNTKIYDWYGQAERVCAIAQCSHGTYHVLEDYAITEFINEKESIEIVGTPFYNYVMPLIRYKTGDIIELKDSHCGCNSKFQAISKIIGRKNQYFYFYTQDGPQILRYDRIPIGVDNIIEIQFIQNNINELIINIVPTEQFSNFNEDQLKQNVFDHATANINIIINKVESIPRGKNGKFDNVINNIKDASNGKSR